MWSSDFKEFVGLLNERGIRYLVVGGYAVGIHGHPRYTGDLDIWVDREPGNVGIDDLQLTQQASSRLKGLADLEALPDPANERPRSPHP